MDATLNQKISAPGVYDVDIEVYHSQCCAGPSISSSGIRRILQSPALYWMYSDLNPNRVEEESSEALILGQAAHHLLLGEAGFREKFTIRPEELYGEKWNGNRKDCKAWLKDQAEAGLIVLTPAQIETIKGLAGIQPWQKDMPYCGLRNHPLVQRGILNGEIEKSMFWKDGRTWLKARPDAIPADGNDVVDLKTTTSVDTHDVSRTIFDRGYHVQAAMIGMGMKSAAGRKMDSFSLIWVDKTAPHEVSIRHLSDEDIILGERAIEIGVRLFERCLLEGRWPGAPQREPDISRISLPQWGRDNQSRQLDEIERILG